MTVPDREKPFFMEMWRLRTRHCHHDWGEERCATELNEEDLLTMVLRERQVTADPTLPVPKCAVDLLGILGDVGSAPTQHGFRHSTLVALSSFAVFAVNSRA